MRRLTTIHGLAVSVEFDLEDNRSYGEKALDKVKMVIKLQVDDQTHTVRLQCEDDGLLETDEWNAECHGAHLAAARALGWDDNSQVKGWGTYLDEALEEVIQSAQELFDAHVTDEVLNAYQVDEVDRVTGFKVECGCLHERWGFTCEGDGYLTMYQKGMSQREMLRYRLDAGLVELLEGIKREYRPDDTQRTLEVLSVFNPRHAQRSPITRIPDPDVGGREIISDGEIEVSVDFEQATAIVFWRWADQAGWDEDGDEWQPLPYQTADLNASDETAIKLVRTYYDLDEGEEG